MACRVHRVPQNFTELFIFPCAGNVGCSPLPCMLMCMFLVHVAHETAGAARIRHSLRPLNFRGRNDLQNFGQIMPREREGVSPSLRGALATKQSIHPLCCEM